MKRFALAVLLASVLAHAAGDKPAYYVIVNTANPTTQLDRKFVADVFLKKQTRWADDSLIKPVDLSSNSPVRERFTEAVLGRTVSAVKSFWEQNIFAGRDTPPPELDSDDAVIKFVIKHPGAMAYVSPTADVSAVKIITLK